MSEDLSQLPLAQIKNRCQQERKQYQQNGNPRSLACIELFRRAFVTLSALQPQALDEATKSQVAREKEWAFADIMEIFAALTNPWMQQVRATHYANLTHYLTPDLVAGVQNEIFARFFRHAPNHPDLINTDQLGRLLAYLKKCTESVAHETILQLKREAEREAYTVRIDQATGDDTAEAQAVEKVLAKLANRQPRVEQILEREERRQAIANCLEAALQDEQERAIFSLRYEQGMPPREIFAHYQAMFSTYQTIENTLQRISRRLKVSDCWQQLTKEFSMAARPLRRKAGEDSLLKIELDRQPAQTQKDINVDTPCYFTEEILLDYLCGLVSAETAVAIEASPACHQLARQLAYTHGPWLKAAYRLHCPEVATLIAYQARDLPATERLLCYRHLAHCARCQEELAMIAAPEANQGSPLLTSLRRVIEAIFQSPLALQFQGEWRQYNTPQVTINIDERQSPGQSRTWIVRAQVRDHTGQLLINQVELARLEAITPTTGERLTANGTISATSVSFRDLPAGDYSLQIVLPEEEIIIRQFTVGFTV